MTEPKRELDNAAWLVAVVREYEGPLVRYAQRLLGDAHRAQDVVQDTFVKLCREPRERIAGRVRAWLYSVCRNRAMDVLKKEQRMTTLTEPQAQELASRDRSPSATLERQETLGQATAALAGLPANQQEVIRLKVLDGLSYREISGVTGLSVSNVGFLIHQGIKTIREQLACA
jgi:RNA polymerase sigma-70 factor (ECF subfamily)